MQPTFVTLQIGLGTILAGVVAVVTVLSALVGIIRWIHKRRWSGVRTPEEQQAYLEDQFLNSVYGGGALSGTVTNIDVNEDSGIWYRINKTAFAEVSGNTDVTMRFNRTAINEDRLDREPFTTLFSNPSRVGLVDGEHLRTQVNAAQGYSLVQIRVSSLDYDDVGSWCAALPQAIWGVIEREQI